jgi:hypothetical protein
MAFERPEPEEDELVTTAIVGPRTARAANARSAFTTGRLCSTLGILLASRNDFATTL